MSTQQEFDRLQAFVGNTLNDQRKMELYRRKQVKPSLPLAFAKWLLAKRTGHHPDQIIRQLDAFRQATYAGANRHPGLTQVFD